MGCVCGHRLGRPEALLATRASRLSTTGARGIGEHSGSGGGLGRIFATAFRRPPHRAVFGAIPRGLGLHAHQVSAPGAVPGAFHHGRTVSADVLPFWRQRRSERYGIAAGSVVAPSGSLAPTANGRRGNPLVAICGGRSTANGGREDPTE